MRVDEDVLRSIEAGAPSVYRPSDGAILRAATLQEALVRSDRPNIHIEGAVISGPLDLSGLHSGGDRNHPSLTLKCCLLPAHVNLSNSAFSGLCLAGSAAFDVRANNITIDGELDIAGVHSASISKRMHPGRASLRACVDMRCGTR